MDFDGLPLQEATGVTHGGLTCGDRADAAAQAAPPQVSMGVAAV